MEKIWLMVMVAACTGCTTYSLEEYTLRQTKSCGEGRDTMVLSCLATVAADPRALPPFSLYSTGITSVTDSVTLAQTSAWAPMKYTLETIGLTGSTTPKGQWTVDPASEYQQLEAMHAACLWALFGPERAWNAYPTGILGDPRDYLDGKPHFGVVERLGKTRPGWVRCGRLKDVPLRARYKGHVGNTWVWVMPEDSESFAQFTLALQDIATLDPANIAAPPLLVQLTNYDFTQLPDLADKETERAKKKYVTISTAEQPRAVKREYKEIVEKAIQEGIYEGKVKLTRAQWMAYTEPWPGMRNAVGTTTANTAAVVSLPSVSAPSMIFFPPPPNVIQKKDPPKDQDPPKGH